MENLDSRLLRNREEEQRAAGELKEKKRGETEEEGGNEAGVEGEPRTLRQRVMAARQALSIKEQVKKKLEEKVAAPAKAGMNNALRWAWMTLIPSFGLSLIYINIHVFLRMVLGEKLFCKLGEEWIPKEISAVGGGAEKSLSKSVGIIEVMGLLALDLLVLFIIFAILGIIVMIVDFMQAGFLEKTWRLIGGLTNLSWSGIKSLYSLFAQ